MWCGELAKSPDTMSIGGIQKRICCSVLSECPWALGIHRPKIRGVGAYTEKPSEHTCTQGPHQNHSIIKNGGWVPTQDNTACVSACSFRICYSHTKITHVNFNVIAKKDFGLHVQCIFFKSTMCTCVSLVPRLSTFRHETWKAWVRVRGYMCISSGDSVPLSPSPPEKSVIVTREEQNALSELSTEIESVITYKIENFRTCFPFGCPKDDLKVTIKLFNLVRTLAYSLSSLTMQDPRCIYILYHMGRLTEVSI